jgi:hypothetical protein
MRRWIVCALVACIFGGARAAMAEPRFTARYRQDCTLCHQNPTGGGLRSLYASQYLVPTEMSMQKYDAAQLQRIHPDLSPSITVGTDIRTIWVGANDSQPTHNFFQMQGDLYVGFAADEHFAASLDVDQTGSTEIYGIGWILPCNGYVKAGRFTPAFGWKFADHNMFNREQLGFDQPFDTDAGLEFGIRPAHLALHAAVLNGEPGSNTLWDRNRDVAWLGDALWQFHVATCGAGLGSSIYYNRNEPAVDGSGQRTKGAAYGYFNWSRVSWLWEVDGSRLLVPAVSSVTMLVTTHEVSLQLGPGVDVVATYNYVDPNLDLQSGTRSRYGLGVVLRPAPFAGLEAFVNAYRIDAGPDVAGADFVRGEVQAHLFY